MKLTEPDKILDRFEFVEKLPSDSLGRLVEEVIRLEEDLLNPSESNLNDIILNAADNINFQKNWKGETIIKKFNEECKDYHALFKHCEKNGKILATLEQDRLSEDLVEELKYNRFTRPYTLPDKNVEDVFDQVEVYWDLEGIPFKIKLDRIIIKDGFIYLIDFKTHSNDFVDNYYKHKLYLQNALYSFPFLQYGNHRIGKFELNYSNEELKSYLESPKYELFNKFLFVTADTTMTNDPIVYASDIHKTSVYHSEIDIRRKDGVNIVLPGWFNQAKLLYKHIEEDQWNFEIEEEEKGYIELN